MTRVLTQSILALVTLIMPIALIAGMLSFPSTCQCGAELPHDHSLFMLAGHSHIPGAHHHSHDHGASESPRSASVTYDGPTVQLPAANASAQTEGAVLMHHVLVFDGPHLPTASNDQQPASGRIQTPEVPPPRG